jgi:hypothetical protein
VATLDDRIRETVGRLQDELIRTAQDATTQIAAEAAEHATAEARREAELQLAELRGSAARDAADQRTQFLAETEALQLRVDDTQRQLEQSQKDTACARAEIETLTSELEEARKQLDATRDDVEATLRDIELSRRESEGARSEVNRLTELLRKKEERVSQSRRLPEAVRALDEAATFGEVLDTLAIRAGHESGRAAVFLVKGDRLRDWRTVGFDFPSDAARLDIDVSSSGPMAEAVTSGEGVPPRADVPVPEFAWTDEARETAAWPVAVGGSVVAVLYADGLVADNSDEPYWPAFLDVLARHAGRVLEGITVRQAAGLMTGTASGRASVPVTRQSSGSIQ